MNAQTKDFAESRQQGTPLRDKHDYECNPIGLDEEVARSIMGELDRHVSSLFVLFHQYQKHHWLVEGPNFRDLHIFFEECYTELHKDLDAMAERVTVLGGIPTSSPLEQTNLSYLTHEPEGYYPLDKMLSRALRSEQRTISFLRHTIRLANDLGDYSTAELIKSTLLHAEDRAHHIDHYLADTSRNQ